MFIDLARRGLLIAYTAKMSIMNIMQCRLNVKVLPQLNLAG